MTPPVTVNNNNITTAPSSTTTAITTVPQQSQQQLELLPLSIISNTTINNINNNNNNNNNVLNNNNININNNNGSSELAKAILVCWPNSHPFANRTLLLESGQLIKVGRSVARNKVSESNAIFDCKVLSRNHAVIWFNEGKFYIKDTGSSNGTFINNQRLSQATVESQPFEVHSGDIIQFGVDVLENTRKETHGCIVATLKLFLPDGRELKALSQTNHINVSNPSIPPVDLYRLNQYIQEAGQREQILGSKLLSLQKTVEMTKKNSSISWQAMIDEDRLLCRIDMLEKNLHILKKNVPDDALKDEILKLQEDKLVYQNSAKDALRKVYQERNEAMQKLTTIERALCSSEDECSLSREQLVKTQQQLQELTDKFDTMQTEYESKFSQNESLLRTKYEKINSLTSDLEMYKEKLEFVEQCKLLEENEEQNDDQLSSVVNWLCKSDIKNVDGSENIIKAICNDNDNEYDDDFETAFIMIGQNLCDIERCISVILSKEIVKENELDELENCNNEVNENTTNERMNVFKMDILKTQLDVVKYKLKQIKSKSTELSEQLRQLNEKNDKAEEIISKSVYDEILSKYETSKLELESRPTHNDYQAKIKQIEDLSVDLHQKETVINEMTKTLADSKDQVKAFEEEVKHYQENIKKEIHSNVKKESIEVDVQTDECEIKCEIKEEKQISAEHIDSEISKRSVSDIQSEQEIDSVLNDNEVSKNVSTNSLEECKEELRLMCIQNDQCEEELVTYKEKYIGLRDDNLRLNSEIMTLRSNSQALNNLRKFQTLASISPLIALLGYIIYQYMS